MGARVMLVDDHPIFRQGLSSLLSTDPTTIVVGEANDGSVALQLLEKTKPDLVVMDIGMERLNGVEATRQIRKQFPHVKVVVLSIYEEPSYIRAALRAGASGYVLKKSAFSELQQAFRVALGGETYLSSLIPAHVQADMERDLEPDSGEAAYEGLTPRQREILQLIAEGRSRQAIADRLHISPKTVSRHREDLLKALGVEDDASLVRFALRVGIVQDHT